MPVGPQQVQRSRRSLLTHPITWAAIAAVVVLVGWAVLRSTASDSRPAVSADEPGVAHVHGLGVNPADRSLIVATHYGAFRVPAQGDPERIGDSYQDTMGFTVVGPDRFLGSGHPDPAGMRRGDPGRLGLIESSDAGLSWSRVSLSGEVDFHGLTVVDEHVFGWDSGTGRLMVSADRVSWDTRSTLALLSFAVDPADLDHIVAAVPGGLITSTDGARSWTPSEGPPLVALSWDETAGLSGAEAGGALWRLDEASWAQAGQLPGTPQALLATPDALYAAANDADEVTGIYTSTDNGRTWDLRYRDPQQGR